MSENNSITTNIKNNDDNNINTKNNDDIIKAKREARRRKILDNAASRLEKLNGNVASGANASGNRSGNLKQQNSSTIQSNGNVKTLTTTTATKNTTIMNNDQIPANDPEIEYNSNNINFDELLFNTYNDVNNEEGAKALNQFLNKIKSEIIKASTPQPQTTSNNNESIASASSSIFEDNDFNQNNGLYLNDFQNLLSFASPFMSTTTARATTIPPSSSSSSPSSMSGSSLSLSFLPQSLSNYLKKILNYRIHIMIIAFLTYATLFHYYLPSSSLSNVDSSSSGSSFPISSYSSVFLPLLIIELIEIPIFIQNPMNLNRSPSAFIDIALLMQGISSNRTQYAYKLINIIGKILKDFSYFIFFFVFYHLIITNALSTNQINQNHHYDHQILSNNEQIINDINNNNDNHDQFHYEI